MKTLNITPKKLGYKLSTKITNNFDGCGPLLPINVVLFPNLLLGARAKECFPQGLKECCTSKHLAPRTGN